MQENASKYLTTAMPSTTSTPNTIIYCRCRFQNKSNEGPKGRQGTIHNRKQQEARRGVGAEVDHQLAESNTIPTHIGLGSHYIKNWTLVHGWWAKGQHKPCWSYRPSTPVVPWEPNETWFEANFRYYYKFYTWREGIEFLQRKVNTSWWMVMKENIEGQVIMKGKGGGYSNAFSDQSKTLWRQLLVKIVLWKYIFLKYLIIIIK